jgi:glycerate kinase
MTFAGARPENGFELFAKLSRLSLQLRAAALVITGEGMIDRSSLMGKGAGEIARRCRKLGIPCIGLSGSSDKSHGLNKLFTQVHALTDLTSAEQAKRRAGFWLERLAERAALEFKL